jgi:inorganic triphosphatase YgiF
VSTEVEIKFEIDGRAAELLKASPLVKSVDCEPRNQSTIYYDTADQTLRRRGWTLRVRSSNGNFVQTVKRESGTVGLFSRGEWEWPVTSIEPDTRLLSEVPGKIARGRDLKKVIPVIRTEIERSTWQVAHHGSELTIDLDEGAVHAGEETASLHELELELVNGNLEDLFSFAKALAVHIPVQLGVMSKAERGFALSRGTLKGAQKAAPIEISPDMSVAESFSVIVSACLKHYTLNQPLVVQDRDPVALHQARVAMRRLRSAFTLFKPAILDEEYLGLREELRWFTAQLGDARNLDVYLEAELPDEERASATDRRNAAYSSTIRAMGSSRLRHLLLELTRWTALGAWRTSKRASKPIQAFAARRLDRLWDTIDQQGSSLKDLDEETRHRLRIHIKKLRYGIEFFRGLHRALDKQRKGFLKAVETLQEVLGKLNDQATASTLAEANGAAAWEPQPDLEREYLREATRQYRKITSKGPFWSS